nr:hypothetical protein [Gammaproteobacteria bacterium]
MSEAASVAANIFIVPIHEIALSMTESQQQRRARFSEAQLEELAAEVGVDVAAIRREVCPKKKTAKKKAAKKKRSKSKTAETEALR